MEPITKFSGNMNLNSQRINKLVVEEFIGYNLFCWKLKTENTVAK